MASTLMRLQNRAAAVLEEMKALRAKADAEQRSALSDEEDTEFKALEVEADSLDKEIAREKRLQEREKALATVADRNAATDAELRQRNGQVEKAAFPVTFKRCRQLRNITGQDAEKRAYTIGMWALAAFNKNAWAAQWCQDQGIPLKRVNDNADWEGRASQQAENINSTGGFLVPDVLSDIIIVLREQYGVFRREAKVIPMGSDTLTMPRRDAGLTAYFTSENTATTASNKVWSAVELVAKKLSALVLYPTELAEDAIINLADDLAGEIAYAFALKEDQCGFTGDGTSTYGGITGITNKMLNISSNKSLVVATTGHTTYATLTLTDFHSATAALPLYAQPGAKWYCSRAAFAASMERLAYAGGGNTTLTIGGGFGLSFLGYPVVLSQVLDATLGSNVNTLGIIFGDLSLGVTMGDRRGITIKSSDQRYFELDQLALLGTERFDINCHDVGTAAAAGPLVGLQFPSS
jgi:HK97 family phage major capsid protein